MIPGLADVEDLDETDPALNKSTFEPFEEATKRTRMDHAPEDENAAQRDLIGFGRPELDSATRDSLLAQVAATP